MRPKYSDKLFVAANSAVLVLLAVICVYPFYYVVCASFSMPGELMKNNGLLFLPAGGFTLKGYELVFDHPNLITAYRNTLLYVISITAANLLFTSIAAYVLSRRDVKYVKYLMVMMVVTMYFSGGLIPTYILINSLGILDTPLAIVLPSLLSAWNTIILRTAISGIPEGIVESAKIDGAKDMRILFQIMIPLLKATLAVIALMVAVGVWNSWFAPMIYLRNPEYFPISLLLRQILILNTVDAMSDYHNISQTRGEMYKRLIQYAVTVVATFPILCLYPFIQKYFVKGVMLGSIKA